MNFAVEVKKKFKCLRLWIAAYFICSGFNWLEIWPGEIFKVLFVSVGTDLSGSIFGLQPRDSLNILFVEKFEIKILLVSALAWTSLRFFFYKRPLRNSLELFFCVSILAYSISGRHFMFDSMGLILLSIVVANAWSIVARFQEPLRDLVGLRLTLMSIAFMYFSAFVSKMTTSGFGWMNLYTIPFLLKFHDYLYEIAATSMPLFEFVRSTLDHPSFVTYALVCLAMAVEALSPGLILIGRLRTGVVPVLWIIMHLGFLFVTGIISRSVVATIFFLSLPESDANKKNEGTSRSLSLWWFAVLIVLYLILPNDKYKGSTLVFPIARFNMFSALKVDEETSASVFFFKIENMESRTAHPLILGPTGMHAYYFSNKMKIDAKDRGLKSSGKKACFEILEAWNKKKKTLPAKFEIWVRDFSIKEKEIYQNDQKIFECDLIEASSCQATFGGVKWQECQK